MKKLFLSLILAFVFLSVNAQNQLDRPKLVVGIVVDQMRWDYLYRFYERYGDDGFRRLLNEGFSCENTMLNYIPTYTAVGHASIYTGTVPSIHGIAGNDFIRQRTGEWVHCIGDQTVNAVGIPAVEYGKRSPKNLLTTTITDELKLATNFRSKVIGIALKDRASILSAGHCADAAYWFDGKSGRWFTSTFYMEKLPDWLQKYNDKNFPKKYLDKDWNTLYPLETYTQSHSEVNNYEEYFNTEQKNLNRFPIETSKMLKSGKFGFDLIGETPYGNTMTFDIAQLAVENEQLGADNITDFLAISLSTPDMLGHKFGVNSAKIEDCYLRLDKDLGDFLKFLDEKIGKNNYLLFLTADHACAHNAQFLKDNKMNAGIFNDNLILKNLNEKLQEVFGKEKIVKTLNNYQVNFDYEKIKDIPHEKLIENCTKILEEEESIQYVVEQKKAAYSTVPQVIKECIINGYNHEYSGEIQIIVKSGYYSSNDLRGSTHGTWNPHDAHVPLMFFGKGIMHGTSRREVYITDIAPTLAALLKIQMPNGCIGTPISTIFIFQEVMKRM